MHLPKGAPGCWFRQACIITLSSKAFTFGRIARSGLLLSVMTNGPADGDDRMSNYWRECRAGNASSSRATLWLVRREWWCCGPVQGRGPRALCLLLAPVQCERGARFDLASASARAQACIHAPHQRWTPLPSLGHPDRTPRPRSAGVRLSTQVSLWICRTCG